METQPRSSSRATLVILVVVFLLVGSVALYYVSTTQGGNNGSSVVNQLQSQVSNLQQANSALRAQLAALSSGSNSTASALTSVGLYANESNSVVTVQGDELVTQNTFFGQVTSVATVQGSGFVTTFQNATYVITNNHVVNGVLNITVTFQDGNSYPAAVRGSDLYADLAVLTVSAPGSEFHPLSLFTAPQGVPVGETVFAIGSPYGLSGSMTVGIISQVGRTITESSSSTITIANVLQFSAPINPGNSGGPLLDSNGQVVGITTAAVTNSAGLYFAIPASTILRELPSLTTAGKYSIHPSLGITGVDMTYQLSKVVGSNLTYGVLVQTVASGGPASSAGIRGGTGSSTVEGTTYKIGGDVIVSVDGVKVVNTDALASYLEQNATAGETVQLGIVRSGVSMTVSVVLGAMPSS